ncbi:MAG: DUF3300 domain-containing protein, partial [Armatimonadota bacterium]
RGIFEALGARVDWNADSRTIHATGSDTDVELIIGDRNAMVNGQTVRLDTPAMILRGSTMVPLRFISEALGADVKWFQATQSVSITTGTKTSMRDPLDDRYIEPSYDSGPVYSNQYEYTSFSNAELDTLMAPIALYPDPLIAQLLPAATFPDQIIDAYDLTRRSGGSRDIDRQDWDISVKAISYYPSVLRMMATKEEWTISVGQAYVEEPDRVMRSIQRLRNKAKSYGYLSTNQYQRVYLDSENIRIVPVQPRYIYVPQYNPQVVYVKRSSSGTSNLVTFGLGLLIGSWLNRDVDWNRDRVYYHGWDDNDWRGTSRSQIGVRNDYYVNDSYRDRPIEVDRNVRTRDIREYRSGVKKNAGTYRLPPSKNPNRSGVRGNRPPRDDRGERSDDRDD